MTNAVSYAGLFDKARSLGQRLLQLILPPLCLNCSAKITSDSALCGTCWKALNFIQEPLCARCGLPFEIDVEKGTLCGPCLVKEPTFTLARAALVYDEGSKPLVLRFKHGDRTHMAPTLGAWMQRAGHEFWEEADVLIPVPLHRWRLLKRRYNQAALLAQEIHKKTKIPVWVDGLLRVRPTASQGKLNRRQRAVNVRRAFKVNPRRIHDLQGKVIVLVDDVLTSGATVNECSRILLNAGAKKVFVMALTRVKGSA